MSVFRTFAWAAKVGIWVLLMSCVIVPLWPGLGSTQTRDVEVVELSPEEELAFGRLAEGLKCPVCKSQSLASSTSYMAEEMKRQIRIMVHKGMSEEEILDYFVERYTDWILLVPRVSGTNRWLYAVPAALVVLAVGMWWMWARAANGERSPNFASSVGSTGDHDRTYSSEIDKDIQAIARSFVENEVTG